MRTVFIHRTSVVPRELIQRLKLRQIELIVFDDPANLLHLAHSRTALFVSCDPTKMSFSELRLVQAAANELEVPMILGETSQLETFISRCLLHSPLPLQPFQLKQRSLTSRLALNANRKSVLFESGELVLSASEFNILQALAESTGDYLTRTELLDAIAAERAIGERNVDVHVSRLRRKLACYGLSVRSVRGRGYYLQELFQTAAF